MSRMDEFVGIAQAPTLRGCRRELRAIDMALEALARNGASAEELRDAVLVIAQSVRCTLLRVQRLEQLEASRS